MEQTQEAETDVEGNVRLDFVCRGKESESRREQHIPSVTAEPYSITCRIVEKSPFSPKGSEKICTGGMLTPTEAETLRVGLRNLHVRMTSMCFCQRLKFKITALRKLFL